MPAEPAQPYLPGSPVQGVALFLRLGVLGEEHLDDIVLLDALVFGGLLGLGLFGLGLGALLVGLGDALGALLMGAEELLGRHVDVVTVGALHPLLRGRVLSEAQAL